MYMSTTQKKSLCKHKLKRDIRRGTIILELRWFESIGTGENNVEHNDLDSECDECRQEALERKESKRQSFYKGLKISQVVIPKPLSYEDLQRKIAEVAPNKLGLAIIERPDGSQVLPQDEFEEGEVIIFREIRPALDIEDTNQILVGNHSASWENDTYRVYCKSYRK